MMNKRTHNISDRDMTHFLNRVLRNMFHVHRN
jgi:hypothetical protein